MTMRESIGKTVYEPTTRSALLVCDNCGHVPRMHVYVGTKPVVIYAAGVKQTVAHEWMYRCTSCEAERRWGMYSPSASAKSGKGA
jgi:transcription elongation factor Elf1